jgi:hypothetical protein
VLGIVEAPDQKQAPGLEVARMGGIRLVAVRFEGRGCCGERLRGPSEVARSERDLGLGDDAARATASRGPNACAARRTSAFARLRSPSWAMAMPRSASAGGSSRSATLFSAPRGSPVASA